MKIVELDSLPSRGVLVKDKQKYPHLEISKLGLKQLGLFSTAVSKDNPEAFVEAIRTLVNIPLTELTFGDFYYIVTYIRCNLRTPLSLSWVCDGYWYHTRESNDIITSPQARAILEDPQSQDVHLVPESCGTNNKVVFPFDQIGVIYMPELEDIDKNFEVPHAGLIAEYSRLSKDSAMSQLLPGIQWIAHGNTLRQKLEWLQVQDNDVDLLDQAGEYNDIYSHGPSNLLVGECRKCGTQVKQKFTLSAESFFRNT